MPPILTLITPFDYTQASNRGRFFMNNETQQRLKNIEERLHHMQRYL